MQKQAQSTFDYLILTCVILVVIIPLLFFSTERIDSNRLAELQDALQALNVGITQVNNLGSGTSSVVVMRVPSGVTQQQVGPSSGGSTRWCNKGMLCYKLAGNDMTLNVPADVVGVLPLNEGLHYVQLYNNDTNVLLYECGNNQREAFEQCDGKDKSACGSSVTSLGCFPREHPQACKCSCSKNEDCEKTTGLCDIANGVCIPCARDNQCTTSGQICLGGRCSDPFKSCLTNKDCNYPAMVCNTLSHYCEPCDSPAGTKTPYYSNGRIVKDCNPTEWCIDSTQPSRCGREGIGLCINNAECKSQDPKKPICDTLIKQCRPCGGNNECNYGNEICDKEIVSPIFGACRPCTKNSECNLGDICNLLKGGVCEPPSIGSTCGDGRIEGSENCEFDANGQVIPPGACTSPQRCSHLTCQCTSPSIPPAFCGNGNIEGPEFCDDGANNGDPILSSGCGTGKVCTKGCTCYTFTDYCGDGKISSTGWEQCDTGKSPSGCPVGKECTAFCDCRPLGGSSCGNGRVDFFEECEPGTVGYCPAGTTCLADCTCSGSARRAVGPYPGGPGDPAPVVPPLPPALPGWGPGGSTTGPITPSGCRALPYCSGLVCGGACSPNYTCKPNGPSGCSCQPDPKPPICKTGGQSCSQPSDCGDPEKYGCDVNNCCYPITGSGKID